MQQMWPRPLEGWELMFLEYVRDKYRRVGTVRIRRLNLII